MSLLAKSFVVAGLAVPLLIVVLSVNEVCGAKGLSPSSPEDLELNSISSSNGGGGGKHGHGSEHRHSSKPKYSAHSSSMSPSHAHSHSMMSPASSFSSYSNLNAGYYGLGPGGYNSYPSSSNSYRYNSNYLYGGGNPIIADPYERTAREYNPSSSMTNSYAHLAPAATNYADSPVSDMYMAAAGGGGGGGGGGKHHHGWGWGWGHGHGNNGLGDKGLGLLGLLGLLSLLQGVLAAFRSTTAAPAPAPPPAMGGRRKRDAPEDRNVDEGIAQRLENDELTRLVLPYLNVIAHARQGTVPMNCTQRQVCFVNKIIKKELGSYDIMGTSVAEKMSHAMRDLLLQRHGALPAPDTTTTSNDLIKSVDTASKDGLADLDCDLLYPLCDQMRHENGTALHPPSLLEQLG